MKKSLLLLACVGMFYAVAACDDDGGASSGADGSTPGGTVGDASAGGSIGTGTATGGIGATGTGGTKSTGGTVGTGTGGTVGTGTGGTGGSSTAGNCVLPVVSGSCAVPIGSNPMGICQEYYNGAIYTPAFIKQVCDASKGVISTSGCSKTGLLGYCDVAVNGTRSFNQYYYGATVAGDPYKVGCMAGGGMWCAN